MSLSLTTYVLGSLQNNCHLVADPVSHQAVIIDPSFGSEVILKNISSHGHDLVQVWITHAHFDHFTGLKAILELYPSIQIGLHPADLDLWREGGGARYFGINMPSYPDPDLFFTHGQVLTLGDFTFEVRHTPGHSPGHVIFYHQPGRLAICGDLIFQSGIGRTDMPGGDFETIKKSIRTQVFSFPGDTRLLPGHGPETTVQQEISTNPFLLD